MENLRKMANGFRIRRFLIGFAFLPLIISCDFLDKPYQIASNFGTQEIRFQMRIRIENFPAFVTSKARYCKVCAVVNGTKWYISLRLKKYCQNKKKYIVVTPSSSYRPDTLGASIFGQESDEEQEDSSFIVNATFKFKQPSTAKEFFMLGRRFNLNTANGYHQGWGIDQIASIDV